MVLHNYNGKGVFLLDPADRIHQSTNFMGIQAGSRLALVGTPCHPRLRHSAQSETGAQAFSPARYGRPEVAYQPIESLVECLRPG